MLVRRLVRPLIGLLISALGGCGGGSPAPQRVLLLVIDAAHADQLGCYGGPAGLTPRIDALAAGGLRFDRAVSNTTWTLSSTASLMTGRLPYSHGVLTTAQRMPEDALLVAELFARAGWRTAAFVQMVYASDSYGLGQGFEHTRYYSQEEVRPPDAEVIAEVLDWMDRTEGERSFLYVHLRRPHSPYEPGPIEAMPLERDCPLADDPAARVLSRADALFPTGEGLTDAQRRHIEHLYRGNLATIDYAIEPLLDRARASDDTLVVLLSDHGEGLGQHDVYGHGRHLYAENVDIPLIFAGPGVAPGVDSGPASTVDVLPTLVELCDLPVPAGHAFDGHSLAARLAGRDAAAPYPIVLVGKHPNHGLPEVGVIQDDDKLVLTGDGGTRLYDRIEDRGELHESGSERPAVLARLRALALRYREDRVRGASTGVSAAAPTVTPTERSALAELGYAGDGD